jgi:hypothetical protein
LGAKPGAVLYLAKGFSPAGCEALVYSAYRISDIIYQVDIIVVSNLKKFSNNHYTKKLFSRIRYPKLSILGCTYLIAVFIFLGKNYHPFSSALNSLGYFGTFIAGLFYAYSFTAAISTSVLLILSKNQNIYFAGAIAAFGAIISDLVIFYFIKYTIYDEVQSILRKKAIKAFVNLFPKKVIRLIRYIIICVFISTPLPTEVGIGIFASTTSITLKKFTLLIYALNIAVIFAILYIGKQLN